MKPTTEEILSVREFQEWASEVLDSEMCNNMKQDDIIREIPASGWYAIYENQDQLWKCPVICFGVQRNGEIVPLSSDDNGYIDECGSASNYKGLYHSENWTKFDGWKRETGED